VWHNDIESFVYCDAQVCYGTDVEHRSLMNRSGICDELSVVIFCFVHTAVLRIKTAFNLVKIHLLFHIMLMTQQSIIISIFVVHVFIVLGSVFQRYAENLCNKLNP
jgi:hypothetical protein